MHAFGAQKAWILVLLQGLLLRIDHVNCAYDTKGPLGCPCPVAIQHNKQYSIIVLTVELACCALSVAPPLTNFTVPVNLPAQTRSASTPILFPCFTLSYLYISLTIIIGVVCCQYRLGLESCSASSTSSLVWRLFPLGRIPSPPVREPRARYAPRHSSNGSTGSMGI